MLTCKCPIQTGLKTNLLKFLKELKKKQLFQASNLLALSPLNIIIRPWNAESLESTNNSPLALEQGVARAKVQMNRRMREREQRELEREQLQTNQDRRETEIRMRRNREMIERERREIRRSSGWREW